MKVLIFLLFSLQLFGVEYDQLLLRAQATVFPKIILLDKNVMEKTDHGVISLNIVHSEEEKEYALEAKSMIDEKYKGKLKNFEFVVNLVNVDEEKTIEDATSYYFFNMASKKKKDLLMKAKKHNKICFGYSDADFSKDILISLLLKEKTYIYLNKSSLNEYNIKFNPIFYKITKVKE